MLEPKRPLKVFLCHAHADRDSVRGLYAHLIKDGVDAWLDKEKLIPGQDWELEIRKAVREADVVVVCLSKQFNQAGFRQKEVRLALDTAMEKPEGEIFIIPARLEECDTLESLTKWHWVDLFEDAGYEMLMRALRARADKIGVEIQLRKLDTSKAINAEEDSEILAERYRLLERLSEESLISVYKAFDIRLDANVIVKIVQPEHIPQSILDESFKRFGREVKALARFSHPHIATMIDFGMHNGRPYFVTPYISGKNLKQLMGTPMPWREAIQLLMPITSALDYVHHQGIIHRDLKPSVILFTDRGQPVLIDFGISMLLNLGIAKEFMVAGSAMGTPEYMAPEQITGSRVDNRADVYALGVILYELITGRKPFMADTPMAVFIKQVSEPLPRPQIFIPDLPEKVEKVLMKALAKDPDDRYEDMAAFASAMRGL